MTPLNFTTMRIRTRKKNNPEELIEKLGEIHDVYTFVCTYVCV